MLRARGKIREQRYKEIFPEEILADSSNVSNLDHDQFEGHIEKPITRRTIYILVSIFTLILLAYTYRLWGIQGVKGEVYAKQSENNRLRHTTLFSERGVIYDRTGKLLAWNELNPDNPDFSLRKYASDPGLSHVLGYVKYPKQDSSGLYYQENFQGMDGVEKFFDDKLSGQNGIKIIETNALGKLQSHNIIEPSKPGENITLSIDSEIQSELYTALKNHAQTYDYQGAAAGMLDIKTGEMIALTNFPEYDSNVLTDGKDVDRIKNLFKSRAQPFLDRFVDGLYTPGSIVKPIIAIGALNEGVANLSTRITSTGSISVPNPFDPEKPTVFKDWKAHGLMDIRRAIAVSSDVFFYEIGGGFEKQKGIGIANIEKYMRMFGLGAKVNSDFLAGKAGVIPNQEWKKENFPSDPEWRIGNTYHTSIGQYGVQVTPMQMLQATAILASKGQNIKPTIVKRDEVHEDEISSVDLPKEHYKTVDEGMRMTVTEGSAMNLNRPGWNIAAKTGTAELGVKKQFINSWIVGYFPYQNPKYAFVFLMERGPSATAKGASVAAANFLEWLSLNRSSYFQ